MVVVFQIQKSGTIIFSLISVFFYCSSLVPPAAFKTTFRVRQPSAATAVHQTLTPQVYSVMRTTPSADPPKSGTSTQSRFAEHQSLDDCISGQLDQQRYFMNVPFTYQTATDLIGPKRHIRILPFRIEPQSGVFVVPQPLN